ncbi:MAG: hypothetical protein ABSH53_23095 [Holophaga sp.]|jgi:hypothetical protein
MSLMDLLPNKSKATEADHLAAVVRTLEAEHSAAQAQLEQAHRAWSAALVSEAEGRPVEGSSADELELQLNNADRAADRAAAALEAAKVRLKWVRLRSDQATEADRWDRAETLAVERNQAVARLADSAAKFVNDYHELFKVTAELSGALPRQPDPDGAMLPRDLVEIAVRKELVRLGLPWALTGAASLQLEPIAQRFEGIPNKIHGWRETAVNKR